MKTKLDQINAIVAVQSAVLESIPEKGIPSGTIYAAMMGFVPIDHYQALMASLKATGAIKESGHYLTRGADYESVLGKVKVLKEMLAGK